MAKVLCPECKTANESQDISCTNCSNSLSLESNYFLLKIIDKSETITFLAYDKRNKEKVVIKEFSLANAQEWNSHDLFKKEGDILAQLNHKSIPKFIDDFETGFGDSSKSYIVMEYIDGINLKEEQRKKRYTEEEIIEDILEITAILEYLHNLIPPIVHQDLNLSNIIRRKNGSLVLIDFNAVKDKVIKERADNISGVFAYIAPEQLMGKAVVASDYYALGILILVLLTRKSPDELIDFDGKLNWKDSLQASDKIIDLIENLLIEDPKKRLQSLNDVKDILYNRKNTRARKQSSQKNDSWGPIAKLRVVSGMKKQDFEIKQLPIIIGRAELEDGLQINHNSLSRKHCKIIQRSEDFFYIFDLESTHGVKVNNKKVNGKNARHLKHGDKVQIGDIIFKFLLKGYEEFEHKVVEKIIKKEVVVKNNINIKKYLDNIIPMLGILIGVIAAIAAIIMPNMEKKSSYHRTNNRVYTKANNTNNNVSKNTVNKNLTKKELYKLGKKFQDAKDYKKANLNFMASCNKGNIKSCEFLGWNYEKGLGVKKDNSKAKKYYTKACNKKSGYSCNKMGYFTEKESIYYTAYYKAKAFYLKSCNLKFGLGCKNLGDFYRDGKYVRKSRRTAKKYYRKACKLGYKKACNK